MLYIKFKIQDISKYKDFQKLYEHMVQVREPGFIFEEEAGPEFDWDGMTQEEVDASVEALWAFLDIKPEDHRYKKLIPSYANNYLEAYLENDNKKSGALGILDTASIMNYLECGFEVDLNYLEEQQGNVGIAEFSTGNYPFGGLERFIMVLHAFDILPTECFDGFAINQFKWTSNFEYDLIELPEKTKQYLKK